MRFTLGCIPFLGYHHKLIFIFLLAIVFVSLLLAGCTSSTSVTRLNIYLVSLSYHASDSPSAPPPLVNPSVADTFKSMAPNTSLEIRAGYFALCIKYSGSEWSCSGDVTSLVQRLEPDQDPANLIWHAANFKDTIVFYGLILAAVALLVVAIGILMTFPGWHEEIDDDGSERDVKPFPSRQLSYAATLLSIFASTLALLSMLWQHVASVTFVTNVENMTYLLAKGQVGAVGLSLGWLAVGAMVLGSTGLLVMILSIRLLDRLTDD
ncbi:MAG: hypothetical protein LQ348_002971 [Seirophora lacunosa]|nr:MAG: hypothetical protein LQ348_002971 [Seirophora lacunosa]